MRFAFIYSTDGHQSALEKLRLMVPNIERTETGVDGCSLFTTELNTKNFLDGDEFVGLIQGYVRFSSTDRNDGLETHNGKLFQEMMSERFPLSDDNPNSFTSFVLDKHRRYVIIANDVMGFYPIYYYQNDSALIICSHLLLFNRITDCDIDHTGVTQRLTAPDYCNFGSRTILKNVFRLLPGEYIKFELSQRPRTVHRFDNSLYTGEFNMNLRDSAQKVWDVVRSESESCFKFDKKISIGLSGGMDSRILLASLPPGKEVTCYTYGAEEYYETRIAKSCAQVLGTGFQSFPEDELLFPRRELLKSYVQETEAVGINQWLSILENATTTSDSKTPIAIGESTEGIAGRNIKEYSSRNARINAFLGLKRVNWTPLDNQNFEIWKQKNTKSVLARMPLVKLPYMVDHNRIMSETEADLEQLYQRIAAHDIKYVELLDELFSWYTHGRIPISNQLLLLRTRFFPVCPTMSARALRVISGVHPSLRLNSRLMDEIFRLPDLKGYSRIPTAQIPFIRYSSNEQVKLLVWGLRSKTDQLLMKLASIRNKASARSRVLKSTNWALAYSKANAEVIRSWFSPDFVGGEAFVKIFEDRAKQTAHPLIPFDIVSAAGLNMEIDFIKSQAPFDN